MDPAPWTAHYEPGVPHRLEYATLTLPEILARAAADHGEAPAILFQNCRMTYSQLAGEVDRLATALHRLGVAKGERVAIHLPNLPQTVIAFYAVLRLGAVVVMTNPMYVAREVEEQWNDAEVVLAITADFLYERTVGDVLKRVPSVRHTIVASIPEYLRFPLNLLAPFRLRRQEPPVIAKVETGPDVSAFGRLVASTEPEPPAEGPAFDDLAVLQYTGGTTGVSKGAMLTHANLSCNVQQTAAWMTDLEPGKEVLLTALPLFHVFGMTVCMNFAVWAAGTMVLVANPRHIAKLVDSIVRDKVTRFPAVPTMYAAINAFPGVEKLDLSSVKSCLSGSAPLPSDTQARFEELTGGRILEGFGLTESSPVTHVNPLNGERRLGTIGLPLSDTRARVVHPETGDDVNPGQTGELLIAGPQVMVGYWRRPAETAEVLKAGWLHTGDLATMDTEGYFKIVGRIKDMIVAGGFNVYPDEIDEVLMQHPAVAEACTIGIPDEYRGETVKSFIVVASGAETNEDDLIMWCRERLAAYKLPRGIAFRDELPRSAVLKLLRRELRDQELAAAQKSA